LGPGRIWTLLGDWREEELARARADNRYRWLSDEGIADLYQDVMLLLIARDYESEEHLRHTLRLALRHRMLNTSRHARDSERIIGNTTPDIQALAAHKSQEQTVDHHVLARADRQVISEFFAELTEQERRVFWLHAVEGLGYQRIAKVERLTQSQARGIMRGLERKRARFQILWQSGRLCGYRAQTIASLKHGQALTPQLTSSAVAHLAHCTQCRQEHQINAQRLRVAFQRQAAALIVPLLPAVTLRGRLTRLVLRARGIPHEAWAARMLPEAQAATGERTAATILAGGAGAKIGAGLAAGLLFAAGALATHLTTHHQLPHHTPVVAWRAISPNPEAHGALLQTISTDLTLSGGVNAPSARASGHRRQVKAGMGDALPFGLGYAITPSSRHRVHRVPRAPEGRVARGGFAYLGMPTTPPRAPRPREPEQTGIPGGGGEFSP
jgi:RNA polymerase sigma factor (sigma-70 family)